MTVLPDIEIAPAPQRLHPNPGPSPGFPYNVVVLADVWPVVLLPTRRLSDWARRC